jgi:hypothetical protein
MVVVEMPFWSEWRADEIGRSFNQYLRLFVLRTITIDEGVTDDLRVFAKLAGIDEEEVARLAGISGESGEDPVALVDQPLFGSDAPVASVPDGKGYTGDFPNPAMKTDRDSLAQICSVELDDDLFALVDRSSERPPWLRTTSNQREAFRALLAVKDYGGAWLSLNSRGWTFTDLRASLSQLAAAANDAELSLLADAWLATAQPLAGGY